MYVPECPAGWPSAGATRKPVLLMAKIEARRPPGLGGARAAAGGDCPAGGDRGRPPLLVSRALDRPLRRRTVMIWLLWFFALLGFYGLTTWLGALLLQEAATASQSQSPTRS